MGKFNHFTSENMGISFLGHLIALGLAVFLADVVISRTDRFIAPDRVQITMIDLSNVRVSGDESMLYNTNVDDTAKDTNSDSNDAGTPISDDATENKIETPSLVEVSEKKTEKPAETKQKNPDATVAPKKKTVVRVNRDVVSLDRTLTVSVVDALRVAMTRCWNIDTKRPDIADIRAVAHLTMRQNGTVADVWFESAPRAETDPAFAYVLQTIRSAINVCQPFRMLPAGEFEKWRRIQLTFYPTQGKVM